VGALVSATLISCSVFGFPSITGRIAQFEDALNQADRTEINQHFHPDETANYDQIKDQEVFTSGPLYYGYEPFTIEVTDDSDPDRVEALLTNDNLSDNPITFKMARDGLGWLIEELSITVSSYEYTIKQIDL
jgi:hypothetical protein